MMRCLLVAVIAATMLLMVGNGLFAAESPWETIEWGTMNIQQKFQWAVDLYRMNRPTDSAEVIKRVIADAPKPRDVVVMNDKLDMRLRARMLADVATSDAVKKWAEVYNAAIDKLRLDNDYINEVTGMLTGDASSIDTATKRLLRLKEFAVPHIIKLMVDAEDAKDRATCLGVLLRLNRASVLPAIEFLEVNDDTVKVTLLNLLGQVKDGRAIAAVCRLAVDSKASAAVRAAAVSALKTIYMQPQPGIKVSKAPVINYWRTGNAYLHEEEFTAPTMDGDQLPIWKWSTDKKWVGYRLVPRNLYNEEMAEEACFDGLDIDKDDLPLRSLAISVYFAEKLEVLADDDEDVNRSLQLAILVGGKKALNRCLSKALDDGDKGIAIQAAQALGKVGEGKNLSMIERLNEANALLKGLACDDRAVRFAAARAVMRCQPVKRPLDIAPAFDNSDRVLPALSWGLLYPMKSRTVLIVHSDTGVINYFKGEIRRLGHNVLDSTTLAGGLKLATSLPTPDVVLVSDQMTGAVKQFRRAVGNSQVPIVLLASDVDASADPTKVLVGRASEDSIKTVLAKASDIPEKDLVSKLIPGISLRAAQALASGIPGATPLDMKTSVPALRLALVSDNDDVLIAVLKALGNIAPDVATLDVLAVATRKEAAKPVRLAALDALAKILEAQTQVPPDVFTELVPLSSESDADISLAAARAITVAKFNPGQFADLMVLKRVREIKAGRP